MHFGWGIVVIFVLFLILITVVWIFIYVAMIMAAIKFCNAFFFYLNGVRLYIGRTYIVSYTINERAWLYDDRLGLAASVETDCVLLYIFYSYLINGIVLLKMGD